ncbi:MAG: UDP-N-acetylmuramate dehydrogenase [Wenzhouxiangella sp.]
MRPEKSPAVIVHDADLAKLSTFGLPARTRELIELEYPEQLPLLPLTDQPQLVLGDGSNTVFLADWPGRILLVRIKGVEVERLDETEALVHAGAGENWHRLVRLCIAQGLHGVENLVMIPGSVGAAPIQNIGAYGVELSDVIETVTAWDWQQNELVTIQRDQCRFGYRDSRFKSTDRGRYLITGISLRLQRTFYPKMTYQSLAEELERVGHRRPGPRQLAAAVMRLRRHRLPDPGRLANAGSFFKNPVVDAGLAQTLRNDNAGLPCWPMAEGKVKLGAGWMIERLGLRGHSLGDAAVYENHALVLVNRGQASANEIRKLIELITTSVKTEFGVTLEPEPELIGF